MNKINLIKKTLLACAIATVSVLSIGMGSAHAARIDYNNPNNQPIPNPVFNTYYNVPYGTGDEADFVKLRKSTGDPTVSASVTAFSDPVNATCAIGEKFDVRTYIHNGANTEFNNNGTGSAVAKNVKVAMTAPLGTDGKSFSFKSVVSASNAASVTDTGKLNCTNNVRLKLVPQTVKVYSRSLGWNGAPDSAVNGELAVGSRAVGSGVQWGCWDDRIMVVYVVEVVAIPPTPVFTCDALTVSRIGDVKKERKYAFAVRYTANNGATLKSVKYIFGDDNSKTVTAAPFTAEHSYAKDGEYTVTTDLVFTVNNTEKVVTSAKCATKIKTSIEQPCPTKPSVPKDSPECTVCPTNPNLPKDSPECAVCPYNPNLPKDSKDCVKPPVTTIPSTGIGGIVTGLLGSSAAAYGAYAYVESRRTLKKLIGRQ